MGGIIRNPVSRMDHFTYYVTADEPLVENIIFSKPFELDEVRLHLSVAMVSVVDFIIRLSSIFGSAYDVKLLSYAFLGHQDLLYQPTRPYKFVYGDILSIELNFKKNTNYYGLSVLGWEVT